VDLVTAGLVKRIRVSRDGRSVAIFIDYTGSDPSCFFCRFISRTLWARILEKAREQLRVEGFAEVEFYDYATGLRIEL
jgi:hypothetical protein